MFCLRSRDATELAKGAFWAASEYIDLAVYSVTSHYTRQTIIYMIYHKWSKRTCSLKVTFPNLFRTFETAAMHLSLHHAQTYPPASPTETGIVS